MISPFYSACDALKGMHESDDLETIKILVNYALN